MSGEPDPMDTEMTEAMQRMFRHADPKVSVVPREKPPVTEKETPSDPPPVEMEETPPEAEPEGIQRTRAAPSILFYNPPPPEEGDKDKTRASSVTLQLGDSVKAGKVVGQVTSLKGNTVEVCTDEAKNETAWVDVKDITEWNGRKVEKMKESKMSRPERRKMTLQESYVVQWVLKEIGNSVKNYNVSLSDEDLLDAVMNKILSLEVPSPEAREAIDKVVSEFGSLAVSSAQEIRSAVGVEPEIPPEEFEMPEPPEETPEEKPEEALDGEMEIKEGDEVLVLLDDDVYTGKFLGSRGKKALVEREGGGKAVVPMSTVSSLSEDSDLRDLLGDSDLESALDRSVREESDKEIDEILGEE